MVFIMSPVHRVGSTHHFVRHSRSLLATLSGQAYCQTIGMCRERVGQDGNALPRPGIQDGQGTVQI